jgi:hypothetical protein
MQQRCQLGLVRPSGRIIHPAQIRWQAPPALRPVLPAPWRAPHLSGPSLRSTRCLRLLLRYYTPIRHPTVLRLGSPVLPRYPSPPVFVIRSTRSGFPGSNGICAYMIWSPTPAAPAALAVRMPLGVAFGSLSSLGTRDSHYFVAQYTPCMLAVYASALPLPVKVARLATGAPGSGLPRRDFHPQDTASFSWRTQ